jgi:hypothetical protein
MVSEMAELSTEGEAGEEVTRLRVASYPTLNYEPIMHDLLIMLRMAAEWIITWMASNAAKVRLANKLLRSRTGLWKREKCASSALRPLNICRLHLATIKHVTSAPSG